MSARDAATGADRVTGARDAKPSRTSGATSIAAAIGVALLPKCPLCIAVMLSGAGFGLAGAAAVAPFVRPALVALAVLSAVIFARNFVRRLRARRARRGPSGACACTRSRQAEAVVARGASAEIVSLPCVGSTFVTLRRVLRAWLRVPPASNASSRWCQS
jgi:hypothetical protein